MSEMQFTTVDRILSKFHRDLRGTDINESDVIEWIGEALDFLKVEAIQEQAIAFIEVKNHKADMPNNLHMVLQIARNNHWDNCNKDKFSPSMIVHQLIDDGTDEECGCDFSPIMSDCNGFLIQDGNIIDYVPYFDFKFNYQPWNRNRFYKRNYTPVRLANHTLFNTIVCKEKLDLCMGCDDEYTIVGTTEKKLLFSFEEGHIAMSYLRNARDEETGYPYVPDQVSFITAITYYIKWKLAEWYDWNGRAGFDSKAQQAQIQWDKYARQAKNWAKMPKSLDDYQDLLEQSHYLIPNHKKYYGYFGNLNKSQDLDLDLRTNYRIWQR